MYKATEFETSIVHTRKYNRKSNGSNKFLKSTLSVRGGHF